MSLPDVPSLFVSQITDRYIQDNFRKIANFFRVLALFSNFKSYEVTFTGKEDHHKFAHNLGFLPKDVLVTSKTGPGTITVNQDLTDETDLDLTVTDACVVRFLAGSTN